MAKQKKTKNLIWSKMIRRSRGCQIDNFSNQICSGCAQFRPKHDFKAFSDWYSLPVTAAPENSEILCLEHGLQILTAPISGFCLVLACILGCSL